MGTGVTARSDFQNCIVPTGAARLVIGIPGGLRFDGLPRANDNNDAAYRFRVGIGQSPSPVPVPASTPLLMMGLRAARRG